MEKPWVFVFVCILHIRSGFMKVSCLGFKVLHVSSRFFEVVLPGFLHQVPT